MASLPIAAEADSAAAAPNAGPPRLLDLQILRLLAASLVVADHTTGSLIDHGAPISQFRNPADLWGNAGTSAFFVLSGLIMVRQSASLFGAKGGPALFLYRRLTRIVPMYWIATLFFVYLFGLGKKPHFWPQLLCSLFFIPNFLGLGDVLSPLLQPGWTLNFEMAFYLIFAVALFLPRRRGLVAIGLVLFGLVAFGRANLIPIHHAPSDILAFYTKTDMSYFGYGVVIGLFEREFAPLPTIRWPFSPAFLLLIPPALLVAFPTTLGAYNLWEFLAWYAMLVVLLCSTSAAKPAGLIRKALVLLGDASYSTYLFHLAVTGWVASLFQNIVVRHPDHPYLYLAPVAVAVLTANLLGLLIHLTVERRIIHFFRQPRFVSRSVAAPNLR